MSLIPLLDQTLRGMGASQDELDAIQALVIRDWPEVQTWTGRIPPGKQRQAEAWLAEALLEHRQEQQALADMLRMRAERLAREG